MNLSDLFGGGGGAASPFNVTILTTATNATVTTSPAYFLGYDIGTTSTAAVWRGYIRTGSTTGTQMYRIAVIDYNGSLGGKILLGGGVYCPNGIYVTDIEVSNSLINIYYVNA